MRNPPSLLSLAIDFAVLNLSSFSDLSSIPDHILLDLFIRTLAAGKLTEKILKLFLATGNDEVLSLIAALNIQHNIVPVLPTIAAIKSNQIKGCKMSQAVIKDSEVDIVIGALRPDLTSFLNEWRPVFSRFHLIIVKDPDLKEELRIPADGGFDITIYTKSDIDRIVGPTSISFSGYSCRYFGFLVSKKKYVISVDDDCLPAKDNKGSFVDAAAQHIENLSSPATPFFFNTLYDPYRDGADFVRGYPFSLRNGVACALSCGLWLNLADLDAPTQALKKPPGHRNNHYVDAVLTVPMRALLPVSGINIAFDREAVGPALFPAMRLAGEGKVRWETLEDVWSGMCAKVVSDHLGLGVKSGLPYVWREERGDAVESLKKEWEGVKLMEDVVPFFESVRLSRSAGNAEECVLEMAAAVKQQLGGTNAVYGRAAEAMQEWVRLWKAVVGSKKTASVL